MLKIAELFLIVLAAQPAKPTPAAGPASKKPVDFNASVDKALKAGRPTPIREPAKPAPGFREGTLHQEITVTDWMNEFLILPAYRLSNPYPTAHPTFKWFGVPRGGNGGSPGFDPVTRKYWWE